MDPRALDELARVTSASLTARGAARVRHSGRAFSKHLWNTYLLLRQWQLDDAVALAGLCHSVYGTEDFAVALFAPHERALLRDQIGAPAERLVHLFCAVPHKQILAVSYPDQIGAPSTTAISKDEHQALRYLLLANLLEQYGGPALSQRAVLVLTRPYWDLALPYLSDPVKQYAEALFCRASMPVVCARAWLFAGRLRQSLMDARRLLQPRTHYA